jgi:Skp family chaperone for outer membrane proteins
MKNLLTSAALIAALLTSTSVLAQTAAPAPAATTAAPALPLAPARIALVGRDALITNSTAGKAAFADMDARINALQTDAQSQGKALKAEEDALIKQRDVIDAAAFDQRVKAFQDKGQRLQTDFGKRENDLRTLRQYVIQQIDAAAFPIIKEEMEARSANIAMDLASTMLAAPSIDITSAVMAKLNARFPRANMTLPPRPAAAAPAPAIPPKK